MSKISAVIFDFNGTLYFDSHLHIEAWKRFLKLHSFPAMTDEQFKEKFLGRNNAEIMEMLHGRVLPTEEMEALPDSVRNYEPHLALHGGADGLDFYRAIAKNFSAALKPGGYLCFEFGMGQGDDVCRILEENGYTILERNMDYNERERAVLAQYGRKED